MTKSSKDFRNFGFYRPTSLWMRLEYVAMLKYECVIVNYL